MDCVQSHHDSNLSTQLWGIDWPKHLPCTLGGNAATARYASAEEGMALLGQHFTEIFCTDSHVSSFKEIQDKFLQEQRRRYYSLFGDFFVFECDNEFAGILIGNVLDWSSYYIRNVSMHPKFQDRKIYAQFFEVLCRVLTEHGVKRIEGDISVTNHHHLHVVNKMGYVVTSIGLSERFGGTVHVCKYLDDETKENFGRLFSGTHASDLKSNEAYPHRVEPIN